MLKTTALHPEHQRLGARLVDFAGWDMPVHYGSQLDEHHAVRGDSGMFDVAHMSAVDITGNRATEFLRRLLANDVAKLKEPGRAIYGCMLNEQGGVLDDLITYRRDDGYRLVVNAGTTDKDLDWMRQQADGFDLQLRHRDDLGILAVQGPRVRERIAPLVPEALRGAVAVLKPFRFVEGNGWFIATTGYTGEDGFELVLPHDALMETWARLQAAGVRACGLGARDTLRLEAGMNLYGQDMDEQVTPLECGLGWTVAFDPADRKFIGRRSLEAQRDRPARRQVGLVLEGRGVARAHMKVRLGGAEGESTSGGFAPTMKASIALARVPASADGEAVIEIRGKWTAARVVQPPFVRNGKTLV